jgi:2-hydroxychromene-2-carboxylate isomerase
MSERSLPFYLDFISPYTWMALMRAEAFAAEHDIRWELRPVVYGALLDAHGLVGPAETAAKRRYTFLDIVRSARHLGLRFEGPPVHPFRSIEALRTLFLSRETPQALHLAVRLSDACWGRGRSLTDPSVIAEVVEEVGLDAGDLERRISAPEVKQGLREQTEQALALGVFGVPTFVFDGELFWGHDRMEHLSRRLRGETPPATEHARSFLARPQGVRRKRAPSADSRAPRNGSCDAS